MPALTQSFKETFMSLCLRTTGALTLLAAAWSFESSAAPCRDKPLSFSDPTIKVTAYEDCQDSNLAYIVPQELTVQASSFSGQKSFSFVTSDTGARVLMKLNLLTDNNRLSRALIDLRRSYQRPFRFAPFEIQNVKLEGFSPADGVTSQRILAHSSDSNAYFSIALTLDPDGASLWKQAAEDEFYTFQGASLSYQMNFSDGSGGVEWIDQTSAVFLESLPSCEILNNCSVADRNGRLLSQGKAFGRYYFRTQYLLCSDFLNKSFIEPSLDEIEDPFLSESEKETVHLAAKQGFKTEKESVGSSCAVENERTAGKQWLKNFLTDNRITCPRLNQWPFTRISDYLSTATANFKEGARQEYNAFVESCPKLDPKIACDERDGSVCGGTLTGRTQMCVSAAEVAALNPQSAMQCSFLVYERFFGNGFSLRSNRMGVPALTALSEGICLTFNGTSQSRSDYKTQLVCE
jgi:hypothetical protein